MSPKPALLFAALQLALASAALAAADCPPLARVPSYDPAGEAETRAYDGFAFPVRKGDATEEVEVRGRTCRQAYAAKEGAQTLSDLEIQSSYRDQIRRAGGQVLYADERTTVGRLARGADETWLRVYSQETDIEVLTIAKAPLALTLAKPAGDDYRLLGRMPAYAPRAPAERKSLDEAKVTVKDGDDTREVAVQGAKHSVSYGVKDGAQAASDIEIQENYRAALRALNAEILLAEPQLTTARFEQGGQTIWAQVFSQENAIEVSVVEEKPFPASVQPPEARALKAALDKSGRVALHVGFDLGKATLKPDSAKTIAEVARLLKENPGLKLAIEGHTDDIGPRAGNEKLSKDRAAAVADALAAAGIARERLTSVGRGPDQPIADNATSEGRAKNRRVELVRG